MKKTFEQRLQFLENTVGQMIGQMNATIETTNGIREMLMCVVGALVEAGAITEDDIKAVAEKRHREREQQKDDQKKAWIEEQVKAGALVAAEVADDNSVIVGTEYNAKGEATIPGFVRGFMGEFVPELQEKLKAAKVGDTLTLGNDHTFKLLEIYHKVEPAPKSEGKADA
jgi:hypothetical protein